MIFYRIVNACVWCSYLRATVMRRMQGTSMFPTNRLTILFLFVYHQLRKGCTDSRREPAYVKSPASPLVSRMSTLRNCDFFDSRGGSVSTGQRVCCYTTAFLPVPSCPSARQQSMAPCRAPPSTVFCRGCSAVPLARHNDCINTHRTP